MKFGVLLNNLAQRAGIAKDNKALVDLLSKTELSNQEVPDEIASSIETNLFDVESAKNNPNLKSHFFSQSMAGFDAEFERLAKENELSDEEMAELKAERSTFKKTGILVAKIKALEEKKGKASQAGNKGKEEEHAKEIEKLNAQLKTIREDHVRQLEQKDAERLTAISDMKMDITLGGLSYANADLPVDVNITTAKALINREAQQKGAKIKYNPTTGSFDMVRADDESLAYHDDKNNKVSYDDFVKGTLVQNKLLAVADPSKVIRQQTIIGDPKDATAQRTDFFGALDQNIADQQKQN